ncbi:membrane-targeted effector domain-containing toxin [Erwinia amylovora]|uniref:membrane-targeted effector domain-containing toxin n=1 Tax=Erwinia amylovora TaxID=552 RepID=UPI001443A752|nr:membrane-targeted effector domain-containing toxin [Erwinia amylovora]
MTNINLQTSPQIIIPCTSGTASGIDEQSTSLNGLLKSVTNSTARYLVDPVINTGMRVYRSLRERSPWREYLPCKQDIELKGIQSEGEALRSEAELINDSRRRQNEHQILPLLLKGKVGIALGAALLAGAGLGSGYYFRRKSGNFTEDQPATWSLTSDHSPGGSGGTPEDSLGIHPYDHDDAVSSNSYQFRSLSDVVPGEEKISTTKVQIANPRGRRHVDIPEKIKPVNRKISWLLYNENYLDEVNVSKEIMLYAAAGYLLGRGGDGSVGQNNRYRILARIILSSADLYGGGEDELLSLEQEKSAVRFWFFSNVLGSSLVENITKKIASFHPYPFDYTPIAIKDVFSVTKLYSYGNLYLKRLGENYTDAFKKMWNSILHEEMPFLKFADTLDKTFVLHGEKFASLYAGTRFLSDVKKSNYSAEEAVKAGDVIWKYALSGHVTEDQLGYLQAPAIYFMARHSPDKVAYVMPFNETSAVAVLEYIRYRKMNALIPLFNNYSTAVKSWLTKRKLADKIISQCPTGELYSLPDIADGIRHEQERRKKGVDASRQIYMNGMRKPCKSAPENLNSKYLELTSHVADSFYQFDQFLVNSAFEDLPIIEYQFITAKESIMCPVDFSMHTDKPRGLSIRPVRDMDIKVSLEKTELISVMQAAEERIYALVEQIETAGGYKVIRVDRDILKFISAGILDYNKFAANCRVVGNELKSNHDTFFFSIKSVLNTVVAREGNIEFLVNFLSAKHRENLYHSLYESGNDQSDFISMWNVLKHIIPLYDCIDGIVKNEPAQALPSCLMDALSLTPGVGIATNLSGRFAISLSTGIRHGIATVGKAGIALAVKNTLKHVSLPSIGEMAILGKTALRSIDPGFELLSTASRSFSAKIKVLLASDKNTADLAARITPSNAIGSRQLAPADEALMALVPGTELRIPLKSIVNNNGQNVYVRFNPETGEAFGIHYHLEGEQLHQIAMKYPVESDYAENNLEYTLGDVTPLNRDNLLTLTSDGKGVYRYIDAFTHQITHALKINGQFYRVRPGGQEWLWHVDGKNDIKLARFDDVYYKVDEDKIMDVKYTTCRSRRAPTGHCIRLSPKLENAFKENKRWGVTIHDIPYIRPADSHPGLYIDADRKIYIKYENVYFRLKNEHKNKPDDILSVIRPKTGLFSGNVITRRIAEVTVSRQKGAYHFTTPEENMSECAGVSKDVSELHSAMRRLSFADYHSYDIPEEMRETIQVMDKKTLQDRDYYFHGLRPSQQDVVDKFRKITDDMLLDAEEFFKREAGNFNKCDIPTIASTDEPKDVLKKIYDKAGGIVIGESHSSIASKKFIVDNIDRLYENGVRTIFMEHLQKDMHQADLDNYLVTGKMTDNLQRFIIQLDRDYATDYEGKYSFMGLIKAVQQRHIRITAIDSFVSYYGLKPGQAGTNRVKLMNYYSHLLINKYQLHHQNKWIALVGNTHSNTFFNIPGVAELNRAVGIRVRDIPQNEAGGIFKDPGEVCNSIQSCRGNVLQGDILLEMAVVNPPGWVTIPRIRNTLKKPGHFSICRKGNKNVLTYMNRDSVIQDIPIESGEDNKFYLDTNENKWQGVASERFERLDAMIDFIINERGMKLLAL